MANDVFLDCGNLYYCVKQRFPGRKLSYEKYIESIPNIGKVVAFVADHNNKKFMHSLSLLGVQVVSKKPIPRRVNHTTVYTTTWDVEITMAVMDSCADEIIIGSSKIDLLPLALSDDSILIYAAGIGKKFPHAREVTEDLLI